MIGSLLPLYTMQDATVSARGSFDDVYRAEGDLPGERCCSSPQTRRRPAMPQPRRSRRRWRDGSVSAIRVRGSGKRPSGSLPVRWLVGGRSWNFHAGLRLTRRNPDRPHPCARHPVEAPAGGGRPAPVRGVPADEDRRDHRNDPAAAAVHLHRAKRRLRSLLEVEDA